MSEYQRDQAITEAIDRARSRRILLLVDAKLRELAEEAADLLRGQKDDADDFDSLWDAICYYLARDKVDALNKYKEPVHAMCRQALQEYYGDGFTAQVLAAITTECDEFYQKAGRRDEPSSHSLDEWTTKAIYMRLLDSAREDAKSSFLSYDPEGLNQIIACLRSLIQMSDSGSSLATIGRAIEAIEGFKKGRRADLNVDIGCCSRAGDREFKEGKFAFVEIREASIGLSTLHTTYEKQVGSDHSSEHFSFPNEFERWRETFDRIRDAEQAELSLHFPFE